MIDQVAEVSSDGLFRHRTNLRAPEKTFRLQGPVDGLH